MLTFNDLLLQAQVDPGKVAVILHTPIEPKLRAALPWIVQTRRAAFEEYQRSHNANATATLRKRPYMASFVAVHDGGLIFVSLYTRVRETARTLEDWSADPSHRFLQDSFGFSTAFDAMKSPGDTQTYFDFEAVDALGDLSGRLRIAPPLTPTYVRLAENLHAPVIEIARDNQFNPPPPPWREWVLSAAELQALPAAQVARLKEWRGVYLIVDDVDGARYVGSAYGMDNLWGRWTAHAAGEQGVTKKLTSRNPRNFRFAILERVSPDMPADEIIAREQTWMLRLSTREFGLNA